MVLLQRQESDFRGPKCVFEGLNVLAEADPDSIESMDPKRAKFF